MNGTLFICANTNRTLIGEGGEGGGGEGGGGEYAAKA